MGLEGVEIVIETEETFGIDVPEEVIEGIATPGDLIDYVVSRVETTPAEECVTQQLFYRLRRGFRHALPGLQVFSPDATLKSVLQRSQWPTVWTAVRNDVGSSTWPVEVPWGGFLRGGPRTIRELIWYLIGALPRPDGTRGETWTRQRIEGEVRRIIREVTGIRDFQLNDRFSKELGID